MDPFNVDYFKSVVQDCEKDLTILNDPSLGFFRDFLERLGAKVPSPTTSAAAAAVPSSKNKEDDDIAEIWRTVDHYLNHPSDTEPAEADLSPNEDVMENNAPQDESVVAPVGRVRPARSVRNKQPTPVPEKMSCNLRSRIRAKSFENDEAGASSRNLRRAFDHYLDHPSDTEPAEADLSPNEDVMENNAPQDEPVVAPVGRVRPARSVRNKQPTPVPEKMIYNLRSRIRVKSFENDDAGASSRRATLEAYKEMARGEITYHSTSAAKKKLRKKAGASKGKDCEANTSTAVVTGKKADAQRTVKNAQTSTRNATENVKSQAAAIGNANLLSMSAAPSSEVGADVSSPVGVNSWSDIDADGDDQEGFFLGWEHRGLNRKVFNKEVLRYTSLVRYLKRNELCCILLNPDYFDAYKDALPPPFGVQIIEDQDLILAMKDYKRTKDPPAGFYMVGAYKIRVQAFRFGGNIRVLVELEVQGKIRHLIHTRYLVPKRQLNSAREGHTLH